MVVKLTEVMVVIVLVDTEIVTMKEEMLMEKWR